MYGADETLYLRFVERRLSEADRTLLMLPNQALHAAKLWIPWGGEDREFVSPPEPSFLGFLRGDPMRWAEDPFDPQRPHTPDPGGTTTGTESA